MSEETPGSTGGEANAAPPERPTQPTEAATPPTPETPATAEPARERGRLQFQVPRWAAAVVAALVLVAVGFGIGWIAAPGGGHGDVQIGRDLPRFPGGFGAPGRGQGPSNSPGPTTSSGAFLGVSTQTPASGQQGVPVQGVQSGSAADQAGLKAGDVITSVDSNSVTSPAQLSQDILSHQPGDQVTITYTRNGTSAQAQVKLGTRAPAQSG